ncbi:MAG TPA: DUF86 domain-containing protein [Aggregatilineaceae bacterium]|jgi:uncharacterized protein with HEPN domain|nr:DUF86 domain-containing protein [Anaerolineae bacterium]HMM28262.1 DUF86 domain-containing protein [Aggregatilineaceae bacterium]
MNEADKIRLRHMLDAAHHAQAFVHGRSIWNTDRQLTFALTRAIEIIGEAAQVSTGCRDAYPGIPWTAIVGMRNRLIHAYFDMDHDRLWATVQHALPDLIAQIEAMLATGE